MSRSQSQNAISLLCHWQCVCPLRFSLYPRARICMSVLCLVALIAAEDLSTKLEPHNGAVRTKEEGPRACFLQVGAEVPCARHGGWRSTAGDAVSKGKGLTPCRKSEQRLQDPCQGAGLEGSVLNTDGLPKETPIPQA